MAQPLAVAPSPACFSLTHAAPPYKSRRVRAIPRRFTSSSMAPELVSSFKRGSSHFFFITSRRMKAQHQPTLFSVKCGQGTKQNSGLDVWLGRLAMVGFAIAIIVEVSTGKGLLENFGFSAPLPTLALVVTGLVGVLTAFFIFQSASRD